MPIRAASAPVSWGITENIAYPAEYPYSRVLDEITEAGYTGTELGPYAFLPADPTLLSKELERGSLTLCSAFVAMKLGDRSTHAAGLHYVQRTAKLLKEAGAHMLILSDEITPERSAVAGSRSEANRLSWDEDQWKAAEDAIRQVISVCAALGLEVAFHHHVATHVETPEELDRLLALGSVPDLGLCLDTGHCAFGGGDPVAVLQKYAPRVKTLHLKDVDAKRLEEVRRRRMDFHSAVTHGVFVPLGKGMVNFPEILKTLRKVKFEGWVVVEQDVLPGGRDADSPLANAKVCRQFLRSLGV